MVGIIVQARQGSTRLPNKMNLFFYNGQTILGLILSKLVKNFPDVPIILATTINENDNTIVDQGEKENVKIYRGSEENVVKRFVDAANEYNITKIIRVCADNPFLDMDAVKFLVEELNNSDLDYVAFKTSKGVPSIRTHYGFWAEGVNKKSLETILKKTSSSDYLEHVTNYIYTNSDLYNIKLITIRPNIERTKLRLTIDTIEDFEISQSIYREAMQKDIQTIEALIDLIESSQIWVNSMEKQIILNTK